MNRTKPCNNPRCDAERYDQDDADFCPSCQKTTCEHCEGWHESDDVCPFCRNRGFMDCIYGIAGVQCKGCPFKGGCESYEDYVEVIEFDIHESRMVDQYRGK